MNETSSYLRYLPPVLWETDKESEFSLGGMLRIFEKILTGLDDDVAIRHSLHAAADGGSTTFHDHPALEEVIAGIHRLFDPWTTPPDFRSWLAVRAGLSLPENWEDHQRRQAIARLPGLYPHRGVRSAMLRYLELVAGSQARIRITIDDGSALLALQPEAGRIAPLFTLLPKGAPERTVIYPRCLTIQPDGTLFVAENGTLRNFLPGLPPRLWSLRVPRLSDHTERLALAPHPAQIAPPVDQPFGPPVALANDGLAQGRVYLLVRAFQPQNAILYEITTSAPMASTVKRTLNDLKVSLPVAMIYQGGKLRILDRGESDLGAPARPRLWTVDPANGFAVAPQEDLTGIVEPLSLLALPDGSLLIGDARGPAEPANVMALTRQADHWSVTPGLPTDAAINPLVAPIALVRTEAGRFYVLDQGLKPHEKEGDSTVFFRQIARPACIYSFSPGISGAAGSIAPTSDGGALMFPTGMAADGEMLYLCDYGGYSDPAFGHGQWEWRTRPFEFGVVLHFAATPEEEAAPALIALRRDIIRNIRDTVEREKPAHTHWTLLYPREEDVPSPASPPNGG